MDRPTCATCLFFDPISPVPGKGECHEDSPKPELARFTSQFATAELRTLWPPVDADDFCARHRDASGRRAYQDPPTPAPAQPARAEPPRERAAEPAGAKK